MAGSAIKERERSGMKQESFSDLEYRHQRKKTKRENFLEIMDELISWDEWISLIESHYSIGISALTKLPGSTDFET